MNELLIGHLVGDYILQNDWMALNKKKSSLPCLVHCALYTLSVAAFSLFALPLWAIAVIFVTHFIQDRTTIIGWWMNLVGQASFAKNLGPWSSIVVDNVWHLVVLHLISLAV